MHTSPLALATTLLATACLEIPTLDEFVPPPPDLGTIDTWGPLASFEPDADDGGSWGEGPTSVAEDGPVESAGIEPAADPALAQLRITEVLIDPSGKDGGPDSPEFVELVNLGPSPVALAGLRITARSWPILDGVELGLEGVELPVAGVLVIRRHADDVDPALEGVSVQGSVVFAVFLHDSGLRNGDGAVALGPDAALADVLVYGAPPPSPFDSGWLGEPVPTPDSGQSLCRSTMSGQASDHDDASDWAACVPSPGTIDPAELEGESGSDSGSDGSDDGGEEPLPIAMGAVQIVEVASNPPGQASDEKPWEYVEILNTSENEVELSFARIGDDVDPGAPGVDPLAHVSGEGGCISPTCLAPGRRALIVAQGYLGETADALVLATDDSTIADGGLTNTEPVVIWDAFDTSVSSYRVWPDPSGDPLPSDEQPLHRVDALALDEPANWESAPATPGS